MTLIAVENLHKIYRTSEVAVHAVRGVNCRIDYGEFVAITGASGSGKSTFMHVLGCLDQATSGVYAFEGRDTKTLNRGQLANLRNQRIGFVFQSFNLLPRTTILDNVALPMLYQKVSRRERRHRATAMLERVGLGNRLTHTSGKLSGGQQQRVAVARALVTKPPLILADEPTGNLDSKTSHEIMDLFKELNETDGVCVVVVTHEADVAAYAYRNIVFRDGLITSDTLRSDVPVERSPAPRATAALQ